MEALPYLTLVGMILAGLTVGLSPAAFAWIVAWRVGIVGGSRRAYVATCLLMTYGMLALVMIFIGFLLSMISTFAAPVLAHAGHVTVAMVIALADDYVVPCLGSGIGIIAAIVLPLWLRRSWSDIWMSFEFSSQSASDTEV